MEESVSAGQISLLDSIKETFACKENDVRAYSPLTLAYNGGTVQPMNCTSAPFSM